MTGTLQKLPLKVSEFIKEHFKEDFLCEVKEVKKSKGHLDYFVEVSKDDRIHHLRFNENGNLLNEEIEPSFPRDIHEEPAVEDLPE